MKNVENIMLYAGSFDPITNGHLDLINRAAGLCHKLIIGVIVNKSKSARYSYEDREAMIRLATGHLSNVEIDSFDGLLADYVAAKGVRAVLRGLRAAMDFEYELQMAHMNARLYKGGAETLFLMTRPEFSFISSSIVNEVFSLGGDVTGLVPEKVLEYMEMVAKQKTSGDACR